MAAHWSYESPHGPAQWGDLDPAYGLCKTGTRQSPIDITEAVANPALGLLAAKYGRSPAILVNDGRTVQVNCEKGSSLTVDGCVYDLLQFHFHSPSEHHIAGTPFDMEVHLVHRDADGNLAVIGIMMVEGAEHLMLATFWDRIPATRTTVDTGIRICSHDLFPVDWRYYAYDGSLTTPPCTEDVKWFIMKEPVEVSREQIDRFVELIGHNARPVCPLNGRIVERA
ncbi:MAG: carbonic anhydrase family protein [Planctomycetota bacterium]